MPLLFEAECLAMHSVCHIGPATRTFNRHGNIWYLFEPDGWRCWIRVSTIAPIPFGCHSDDSGQSRPQQVLLPNKHSVDAQWLAICS
jgi:hypothetical protein